MLRYVLESERMAYTDKDRPDVRITVWDGDTVLLGCLSKSNFGEMQISEFNQWVPIGEAVRMVRDFGGPNAQTEVYIPSFA